MACQTEMPVATRDPPSCQLERAIWFTAQKDMKLFFESTLCLYRRNASFGLTPICSRFAGEVVRAGCRR